MFSRNTEAAGVSGQHADEAYRDEMRSLVEFVVSNEGKQQIAKAMYTINMSPNQWVDPKDYVDHLHGYEVPEGEDAERWAKAQESIQKGALRDRFSKALDIAQKKNNDKQSFVEVIAKWMLVDTIFSLITVPALFAILAPSVETRDAIVQLLTSENYHPTYENIKLGVPLALATVIMIPGAFRAALLDMRKKLGKKAIEFLRENGEGFHEFVHEDPKLASEMIQESQQHVS